MEKEIIEFINRRFPIDCNWTNGNCYWFALILSKRFNLDIYYLPVPGHFVAGDGKEFFDYYGKVDVENTPIILMKELVKKDPLWAKRLTTDCIL